MSTRTERIQLIKKIITEEVISSQDDLQLRLKKMGCEVTQATLSRDLKLMKVVKVNDAGIGYIYRLSGNGKSSSKNNIAGISGEGANYLADNVLGIEFSGNLGVLKTLPGYASSVAILIDKANMRELLGTIAGDDTILLILREGVKNSEVIDILQLIIPGFKSQL